MSNEPVNLSLLEAVDTYIEQRYASEDEVLTQALAAAQAAGLPEINVSAVQGKLLHLLALLVGARHILEIGTLGGYSAIWLARALPADGRLLSLEYNAHHAAVARENIARAGLAEQVDVHEGAALDLLPTIAEAVATGQQPPFDMVFIDADKPPYVEYFQWALRLTRPGALIVADNTLRQGRILDAQASDPGVAGIQRFNDWLATEASTTASIVPLAGRKGFDGLTIALVRNGRT
ncbi:MAG: O-methyltransferase [Chloroflexaceae bacterium]|nr:O-methyltransferase [Chloroflexaceae bacterium]